MFRKEAMAMAGKGKMKGSGTSASEKTNRSFNQKLDTGKGFPGGPTSTLEKGAITEYKGYDKFGPHPLAGIGGGKGDGGETYED
jgi:hypothetical protein